MSLTQSHAIQSLIEISRELSQRGWLRATSGNLSVRDHASSQIFITRSGADKQRLTADDILTLHADGSVLEGLGKPSFETAVHRALYGHTQAGAVFHVHTVYNNVASRYAVANGIEFHDHEMLKALGHWEEGARITLPVVPNFADIAQLADAVNHAVDPAVPAVLLKRHGLYAFGHDTGAALRHLEAFEFLFEWLCLERLSDAALSWSI